MDKPTEEQIRQRAHEIWERHHRPDGREDEFWHQAEKELQEGDELGIDRGEPRVSVFIAGMILQTGSISG